jgi:hypothetical protein
MHHTGKVSALAHVDDGSMCHDVQGIVGEVRKKKDARSSFLLVEAFLCVCVVCSRHFFCEAEKGSTGTVHIKRRKLLEVLFLHL